MAKVAKPQEFPNPATMCYKRPVMEQAPATAAAPRNAIPLRQPWHAAGQRLSSIWTLAPALLAALTTLAMIGCTASTSINLPKFPATAERQNYDQTYFLDQPIKPLVLPAATGGSGTLTYSLGPRVPPGLEFDSLTSAR